MDALVLYQLLIEYHIVTWEINGLLIFVMYFYGVCDELYQKVVRLIVLAYVVLW